MPVRLPLGRARRDEAKSRRVLPDQKNNWKGRGCSLGSKCCGGTSGRDDHGYLPVDQFVCHLRKTINPIFGPAVCDGYVVSINKSGLLQALTERAETTRHSVRRSNVEKPYHRHHLLLRMRR